MDYKGIFVRNNLNRNLISSLCDVLCKLHFPSSTAMVQFKARKGAIKKDDNALDLHNRIDEFCVWIMCHFFLNREGIRYYDLHYSILQLL